MRICFLADASEMHLKRWVRQFVLRGHEAHVITFNTRPAPDFEAYTGSTLHVLPKKFPGPSPISRLASLPFLVVAMRRIFRKLRPQVTHVHSAGGYAWMATLCRFRPVIISPWGNDIFIDIHRSRINKFLTSLSLCAADYVHCDGDNTRDALLALGVRRDRIHKIFFGTDVNKFKREPLTPAFLAQFPFKEGKIVLSIRTLTEVHGVKDLINAIPSIVASVPDARFVIVGDGALRPSLEELAHSLGVSHYVAFVGRVDETAMVQYLSRADVYVSTSLSESGLAGSTAEAMACGLPIVITRTGDIESWIVHGESGYVVGVSHVSEIALRVSELLNNKEKAQSFGARNREKIVRYNNVEIEMGKVEELYFALAGRQTDTVAPSLLQSGSSTSPVE